MQYATTRQQTPRNLIIGQPSVRACAKGNNTILLNYYFLNARLPDWLILARKFILILVMLLRTEMRYTLFILCPHTQSHTNKQTNKIVILKSTNKHTNIRK